MSNLPALTEIQQLAAVTRASQSLALTSGAGCGKTLVLARRFTTLLLQSADAAKADKSTASAQEADRDNPFDRFVALTFSDKAAVEMVARVRSVLLAALTASKDPGERQRLADWITELPSAHISTIHSFCASLLRRHAVEASVDPSFAVCADELLAEQLLQESAQDAVLSAVEADDGKALDLLARADLPRLVADVTALLGRRIAWMDKDFSDPAALLAKWVQLQQDQRQAKLVELSADAAFQNELQELANFDCADPGDKLAIFRCRQLELVGQVLSGQPVDPQVLDGLSEKPGNIGSAKAWGDKNSLMDVRRRLAALIGRVIELKPYFAPFGPQDTQAANDLAVLTALARQANGRYTGTKRSAGLLDFDDLIHLTAGLLNVDSPVRQHLRQRLSQLLIDECQDTDGYQLQMLWNLVSQKDSMPSDKVFLVGDIKQSIYRFRGAQAEIFNDLCRRFGASRLSLTESFRTHKAGVAFVNRVFGQLMSDYEPIISRRAELPEGPSVEILLATVPEKAKADAVNAAVAELTAQHIAELIGQRRVWDRLSQQFRAVKPGDVAILFSRMTKSLDYERALQKRGLPFYVVAGTGFFQQQEVYDVLNALRVIDNPYDDIALAGVLRSGMFGLDDNVLLHLANAAAPPYFDKLASPPVLDRLDESTRRQLLFAHDLLAELHRAKDALGPAGLIDRLLERTGYSAVLLSQFQGMRKLGNVGQLLDAARASQGQGVLSLSDFITRFSALIINESRYEQAAVAGEEDDVVRIMTIHKAKGLEFPVVVLPDLNAGRRERFGPLIFRPDWQIAYRPVSPAGAEDDDGEPPVHYQLARAAESQELAAEDVRKLYVAMTRHQDHLALIGADWRNADGEFMEKESYLAQLDGVLGISAALEAGKKTIAYRGSAGTRNSELGTRNSELAGQGTAGKASDGDQTEYQARLEVGSPTPVKGEWAGNSAGHKIVSQAETADDVAAGLAKLGLPHMPPLVGPLLEGGTGVPPVGSSSAIRLAATVLGDFLHCPKLYHWRYELRVPVRWSDVQPRPTRGETPMLRPENAGETPATLDPATAGTFFHRCLELLDFPGQRPAEQAQALVARVSGEMELMVEPAPLAAELSAMLDRLATTPLWAQLCSARGRLTELEFVFRGGSGALDVTGKIDLLYQDAGGAWHVVDYKSDRVEPDQIAEHAARYQLQMMIYLWAVTRHTGQAAADATLYFLRPGLCHSFQADDAAMSKLDGQLSDLAAELTRCRRTGDFPRREQGLCDVCPYCTLCLRSGRPGAMPGAMPA